MGRRKILKRQERKLRSRKWSRLTNRKIVRYDHQKILPVMGPRPLLGPEVVIQAPEIDPRRKKMESKQNSTTRADQVGLKMYLSASGVTRCMTQIQNRRLNFDVVFLIQPKVSSQSSVMHLE